MDLGVDVEGNPNAGYFTDSTTIGYFFLNDPNDNKVFHGVVNYHIYDPNLHERHLENLPFSGLRIDVTPGAIPSMESILRSKRIKHTVLLGIYFEDLTVQHGIAYGGWVLYERYQRTWLVYMANYFGEPTTIEDVYRKEAKPDKNPLPGDTLYVTVDKVKDIIRYIFDLMMVLYQQGFYIFNFEAGRLVMVENDAIPKMMGAEVLPLPATETVDREGLRWMWWALADFIRNSLFGERLIPGDMQYYIEILEGKRAQLPLLDRCSLLKNSVALKRTGDCMTYLQSVIGNGRGLRNKTQIRLWNYYFLADLDNTVFLAEDPLNPEWKRIIENVDHRCTLYLTLHFKELKALKSRSAISEEERREMQLGDTAADFCTLVRNFLAHAQQTYHINFERAFVVFHFAFPWLLSYMQDQLYSIDAALARQLGGEKE